MYAGRRIRGEVSGDVVEEEGDGGIEGVVYSR